MENAIINVTLQGVAPLLQNPFIENDGGKPDPNLSDRNIAKERLYIDEKGKIYQPGEHIEMSMTKAAVQFKYKGKKTYKDFVRSGIVVIPQAIPHKKQKWAVDKRSVVINGRSRIMRLRPVFYNWELDFKLEVINPDLDYKVLNEIMIYAGKYIGIGDYRPKFGRFVVSRFENG